MIPSLQYTTRDQVEVSSVLPRTRSPRILFVTPEISHVPSGMGAGAGGIRAKSGGLADVSAVLVEQLFGRGGDVHLAVPHYRTIFGGAVERRSKKAGSRIHLAEDGGFYRRPAAYHGDPEFLIGASLAFQREVVNHIIPEVEPDIVHCNDWMTGLIPASCKRLGIKTVFTMHNIHRERTTLAEIERRGIDVREFWDLLHFESYPFDFGSSYHTNAIDLLSSAIQNADYFTTVSPTFLDETISGRHGKLPPSVQWDLRAKIDAGYAEGILNAPPPSYEPARDPGLVCRYTPESHVEGKRLNKRALQKRLGLDAGPDAPVFFWPSRLDPVQKGCQLLSDILGDTVERYSSEGIQFVIIGDGVHQRHFHDIVSWHNLEGRVAVCRFDEGLSRLAFGGSDFVLMPSSFEPCGLPQMIGARYGTLPVVHDTGGLHDTVRPLSDGATAGNGFVFDVFDACGLSWAIDQAMCFYRGSPELRSGTVARVMREAREDFGVHAMVERYGAVYGKVYADACEAVGHRG